MMLQGYIIKKDGKYLYGRQITYFGIYKYDAARIRSLDAARAIVMKLARAGEKWQINYFNHLNGEERKVLPR